MKKYWFTKVEERNNKILLEVDMESIGKQKYVFNKSAIEREEFKKVIEEDLKFKLKEKQMNLNIDKLQEDLLNKEFKLEE